MNFLAPLALSALGLALPLVLLYFVRLRRRSERVSSLMLWRGVLQEAKAPALLQRFQRDPLLILQLLALAMLALALARPVVTLMGEGERRIAVVLDTSASMKATDVAPTRFGSARAQARALVEGAREGTAVMVIEAGMQPKVSAPLTRDRGAALDAIDAAAAHDAPNRLADAIRTASALLGDDPRAEIHVYTDGAWTEPPSEDARVRWYGTGVRGRNVAITSFSVRKAYGGTGNHEAFVALANFSTESQSFRFRLKVDERTVVERQLRLEPQLRRALVLPFRETGTGTVRAEIDAEDDLATDNVAWTVLPPPRVMRVTLVTEGNLFLENVLRTDPGVALQLLPPARYAGGMGGADVVVLDSATPARIGEGRFVLVNTIPPDVPVDLMGAVERPPVLDWDRQHPVMRNVDLSKITIEEAMRLRPATPGRALAETLAGPLIYAMDEPGRRALLLGFDLFRADLPLRVAFPLLMSNALRWLSPDGVEDANLQGVAGRPLILPVAHGVEGATLKRPDGRTLAARMLRGQVSFEETDAVGLYTLETARGSRSVAVNLADAEESNLAPRRLPERPPEGSATLVPVARELWPLFVLLGIALLVAEALLWWRRALRRGERAPEDRYALGLRAVLLIMLCVALARPALPQRVDRMNVVFLLDASDSLGAAAQQRAREFVEAAVKTLRPEDRHAVVRFGAAASVAEPLSAGPALHIAERPVAGEGSNLQQAIQLGLALLPAGQSNRLVLLSDGRQNAGDAREAARAARLAGADLHYVGALAGTEHEVVAQELMLPQEVKFGEPFQARVVAWSNRAGAARIALFRNGEFVGAQPVQLVAGKNVFAYRQVLDKDGIHVYQAAIEAPGDTIEANNRAVGTVLVRGRPKLLIADKERAHAEPLARALRLQGIEVSVVEAGGLPKDIAGLARYDGVILSNLPATRLDKATMASLRDYVRDQGGGLVMVGGDESFGLGGYYGTPVEEALPVSMEVRQKVDIPNLSIILSIDRSDSMTMAGGAKVTPLDLAKEAAHLVVDLLDEKSEVGVQAWDTEVLWSVPLGPARNKAQIHQGISSIKSGGGTNGIPALAEAHGALGPRPALLKHVIFLSDGQMFRRDFQNLVERMARDQITVSTVALGKYSDAPLMQSIARWGRGRHYYTEDENNIPRIFALETQLASDATMVEQAFRPVRVGPVHEAVQDIDWARVPPLGGYVATTAKPGADLLLASHRDDPLLVTWRYGLGRAAAFTSDANARWAPQWLGWREFNRFWSQVTRWTLRTGSPGDTTATLVRRDGRGEVIVDAVDASGKFINFLDAQVAVVAPDRSRSVIDLEQVGPGRYVGRFPTPQEGVYLVGMAQRKGERMLGTQLAGLVVPYAEELREPGTDTALLQELAEAAGGGALAAPEEVYGKGRRPHDAALQIWPWLVALAALLMLPDIALRRLDVKELWRRRRRA